MAPCTMAALLSNHSPPPMSLSLAPAALVSPIHGPPAMEQLMKNMMEKMTKKVVCARVSVCVCVCFFAYELHLLSVVFV